MFSKKTETVELPGVPSWLMKGGSNALMLLLLGVGIAGLLYLVQLSSSISVPLIIAFVVAIIAYPLVKVFDKLRFPRALSAIIVILIIIGVVWASVQITVDGVIKQGPAIGNELVNGAKSLGKSASKVLNKWGISDEEINGYINEVVTSVKKGGSSTSGTAASSTTSDSGTGGTGGTVDSLVATSSAETSVTSLEDTDTTATPQTTNTTGGAGSLLSGLTSNAGNVISKVFSALAGGMSGLAGLVGSAGNFAFGVFIFLILTYYILSDYNTVMGWIGGHIGFEPDTGKKLLTIAASSLRDYFKGTTITAFFVALGIAIGLAILKVPLIFPIAIVTFLTAYIPFFGAIISAIFACLIALGSGGFTTALITLAIVLVMQNLLQSIINAKFMGDSLNLHPLVVLTITIMGSTFGGLLGAALAAPALAMVLRARNYLRSQSSGLPTGEQQAEADEVSTV